MQKGLLTILCSILLCVFISAQNLTISNGSKTKTFSGDKVFHMVVSKERVNDINTDLCENCINFKGELIQTQSDALKFNVKEYSANAVTDDGKTSNTFIGNSFTREQIIVPDEIVNLRIYNSLKSMKTKSTLSNIGAISLFAAIPTAIVGLTLKDKTSKNTVLTVAAAESLVGVGFILGGNTKKYKFEKCGGPWRVSQ